MWDFEKYFEQHPFVVCYCVQDTFVEKLDIHVIHKLELDF